MRSIIATTFGVLLAIGIGVAALAAVDGQPSAGRALSIKFCNGGDLRLSLQNPEIRAMNSVAYIARLENVSQVACTLDGYPDVLVSYKNGTEIRLKTGTNWYVWPYPAIPSLVTVMPREFAQFVFGGDAYAAAADNGQGAPCPTVHSMSVTLPGRNGAVPTISWPKGANWPYCAAATAAFTRSPCPEQSPSCLAPPPTPGPILEAEQEGVASITGWVRQQLEGLAALKGLAWTTSSSMSP